MTEQAVLTEQIITPFKISQMQEVSYSDTGVRVRHLYDGFFNVVRVHIGGEEFHVGRCLREASAQHRGVDKSIILVVNAKTGESYPLDVDFPDGILQLEDPRSNDDILGMTAMYNTKSGEKIKTAAGFVQLGVEDGKLVAIDKEVQIVVAEDGESLRNILPMGLTQNGLEFMARADEEKDNNTLSVYARKDGEKAKRIESYSIPNRNNKYLKTGLVGMPIAIGDKKLQLIHRQKIVDAADDTREYELHAIEYKLNDDGEWIVNRITEAPILRRKDIPFGGELHKENIAAYSVDNVERVMTDKKDGTIEGLLLLVSSGDTTTSEVTIPMGVVESSLLPVKEYMEGTTDLPKHDRDLIEAVQRVSEIQLTGAPTHLLLDAQSLLVSGKIPFALHRKLQSLSANKSLHITVIANDQQVKEMLSDIPGISIVTSSEEAEFGDSTIAIVSDSQIKIPEGVYVWYVGDKEAPTRMNVVRIQGARGTDVALGLYGTAIVQDKAGVAFRAAGRGDGEDLPTTATYDASILDGISSALAPVGSFEEEKNQIVEIGRSQIQEFMKDAVALAERSYPAIDASVAANGAIAAAAAPKTDADPNYWFFWQRDAGQIAIGMAKLASLTTDPILRERIQDKLDRYIRFVSAFPNRVGNANMGVSRCTIEGDPIKTYGNPQNDGPAHTALAIMTIVKDPVTSFETAKPFLDFLTTPQGSGLTFDPWEFSVGDIFNAVNLARRALHKGIELAEQIGDIKSAQEYRVKEEELQRRLTRFVNPEGILTAGRELVIPWMDTISNLDIGVIGSTLTGYDVRDDFMNVDDPHVMATMKVLEGAFEDKWLANRVWRQEGNLGMGMGRFPEDTNDGIGSTGGNPWTFATLWAAQYYLRLIERYNYLGKEDSGEYSRAQLLQKADGYLEFVLAHENVEALSEQIDGKTGSPRGADKLAWAHAELINTLLIRSQLVAR